MSLPPSTTAQPSTATQEQGLVGMPAEYCWSYRPLAGARKLVISLSAHREFILEDEQFASSRIDIADRRNSYYTFRPGAACRRLLDLVDRRGYRQLMFVGPSKGGFGALLWAAKTAQFRPDLNVHCLAFSPQTRIFPTNDRLLFRSYQELLNRIQKDSVARRDAENWGDLKTLVERQRRLRCTIVYGEQNGVDVLEANRLMGPHIRKVPVPIWFHASMLAFSPARADPQRWARQLEKLYERAGTDDDLAAALPANPQDIVDHFKYMDWIPTIDRMIEESFAIDVDGPALHP